MPMKAVSRTGAPILNADIPRNDDEGAELTDRIRSAEFGRQSRGPSRPLFSMPNKSVNFDISKFIYPASTVLFIPHPLPAFN